MNKFSKIMMKIIIILALIGIFCKDFGTIAIFLLLPAICLLFLGFCTSENKQKSTITSEITKSI